MQIETFELDKSAQFRRDIAGQSDIAQIVSHPGSVKRETPKVFKVAQFRRDLAGKLVYAQGQDLQIFKLAQFEPSVAL